MNADTDYEKQIVRLESRLLEQSEKIEDLEQKLHEIRSWCQAYPLGVFTEPDWAEVKDKLGATLLTQVSGSNMRHVVEGIQKIIDR